jgi:hypothetical protein
MFRRTALVPCSDALTESSSAPNWARTTLVHVCTAHVCLL